MSLGNRELLNTPGLSAEDVNSPDISRYQPVGANYSVIPILFTKKIIDDILTVCISYIFVVYRIPVKPNCVIRHHRRCFTGFCLEIECSVDEWNEMVVK